MPRGTELNNKEKAKIQAFKELDLSNREIAKRLNRSPNVIDHYVASPEDYHIS